MDYQVEMQKSFVESLDQIQTKLMNLVYESKRITKYDVLKVVEFVVSERNIVEKDIKIDDEENDNK